MPSVSESPSVVLSIEEDRKQNWCKDLLLENQLIKKMTEDREVPTFLIDEPPEPPKGPPDPPDDPPEWPPDPPEEPPEPSKRPAGKEPPSYMLSNIFR